MSAFLPASLDLCLKLSSKEADSTFNDEVMDSALTTSFLCSVVILSTSERNILLTEQAGSASVVFSLIKSGVCISAKNEIF